MQYSKIEELASTIRMLDINSKKDGIISTKNDLSKESQDRFAKSSEQQKQEIANKQKLLEKNIKKFKKRILENQFKQGIISKKEYENARNSVQNHEFSIDDVSGISEDMEKLMNNTKAVSEMTTEEKFEDYIRQVHPKTDILETIEIDDYVTKAQLFQLYGFQDTGNLQLIAMRGYDHKKYSEISKDLPDKEAGEGIALYVLDRETGEIKNLLDNQTYDEFEPADLLSKDKMLEVGYEAGNIVNGKTTKSVQELATFGYRGLNLTFFRDQDGSMKVARKNERGEIQEISTKDSIEPAKTIEDILKEKSESANTTKKVPSSKSKEEYDDLYDEFDDILNTDGTTKASSPKSNEKFDEMQHTDEDMHFDDISKAFFETKEFRDFKPEDFEKIKANIEFKRQVEARERVEKQERDVEGRRGLM